MVETTPLFFMKNKKADSQTLTFVENLGKEYGLARKSIIRRSIEMALQQVFEDHNSADHTVIKEAFYKGRHFIV